MNSTWLSCPECFARWFFQFESGEAPLRHCTSCGSELVEYVDHGPSGPAGGGCIDLGYDPDREVIAMIRRVFGTGVKEVDPSERWTVAKERKHELAEARG